MEKERDVQSMDLDGNNQPIVKTPFILNFITQVEGAMAGTTSGTWSDIDGSDCT